MYFLAFHWISIVFVGDRSDMATEGRVRHQNLKIKKINKIKKNKKIKNISQNQKIKNQRGFSSSGGGGGLGAPVAWCPPPFCTPHTPCATLRPPLPRWARGAPNPPKTGRVWVGAEMAGPPGVGRDGEYPPPPPPALVGRFIFGGGSHLHSPAAH